MTPEILSNLIRNGPDSALVEGLARLDERERRTLSKSAAAFRREVRNAAVDSWWVSREEVRADLAVLGLCALTEAKRTRVFSEWVGPTEQTLAVEVLCSRRPDWLEEWVEHRMSRRQAAGRLEWPFLDDLVTVVDPRGPLGRAECGR